MLTSVLWGVQLGYVRVGGCVSDVGDGADGVLSVDGVLHVRCTVRLLTLLRWSSVLWRRALHRRRVVTVLFRWGRLSIV